MLVFIFHTVLVLLIFFSDKSIESENRLGIAILIGLQPLILHSIGMEFTMLLAVVAISAFLFQNGYLVGAGLIAGFGLLIRPEGILIIPVLLIASLIIKKRKWYLMLMSALMTLGVSVYIQYQINSSFFPHTALVKSIQSNVGYWSRLGPWWVQWVRAPRYPLITWLLVLYGSFVLLRESLKGRYVVILVLFGFGMAQGLGYSVFRAPLGYHWYSITAHISVAIAVWLAQVNLFYHLSLGKYKALISAVTATVLTLAVLGPDRFALPHDYRYAKEYKAVGLWINDNMPLQATVAAVEIGYIGFYSKRNIVDPMGLLHESSIDHIRNERWYWWYDEYRPDAIVLRDRPWAGEPSVDIWPDELWNHFSVNYERSFTSGAIHVYVKRCGVCL